MLRASTCVIYLMSNYKNIISILEISANTCGKMSNSNFLMPVCIFDT